MAREDLTGITKQVANGAFCELSPVCAVLGGVVAKEVIAMIAGNSRIICNHFVYHAMAGDGIQVKVGVK